MIGFFQVAPNDQSIYYLGQIFGLVGDVLPSSGGVPLLLGAMFKTLNTMFLTVGAIIVVYVTIVGVIKTASEGEFLGKQWDKTWVPLRTVFGIAALFPTANGYSVIQVFIMWLIVQGVGAADTLWTTVLNYVQTAGSPTASIQIPEASVRTNLQTLFEALTCQAGARGQYPSSYSSGEGNRNYYYCKDNNTDPFCSLSDDQMWNVSTAGTFTYPIGPSGTCGSLTYANPANCPTDNPQQAAICQAASNAQKAALQSIVTLFGGIAKQFTQSDNDYIQFYSTPQNPERPAPVTPWIQNYCTANGISAENCCITKLSSENGLLGLGATDCSAKSSFPDVNSARGSTVDFGNASDNAVNKLYWPYAMTTTVGSNDFIGTASSYYINTVIGAVLQAIQNQPPSSLGGWMSDAQNTGWALAGGYYYKMAQMSGSNLQSAIPMLSITGSDPYISPGSPSLKDYRNNYEAANGIINTLMQQAQKDSNFAGVSAPPQLAGVSSAIGSSERDILKNFQSNLTASSQPIVAVAQFGYGLLIAAQVIWSVMVALSFVVGWAGGFAAFVLGTGVQTGISSGLMAAYFFIAPAVMALVAALFGLGAMLGIYVPFIPYMIFTIGVVGWLIAAIEAIVAGPLIALGILAPGGQHAVLGRADQAVMMMFNLILRPALMVFGMMASMLLSVVVVNMINSGFGAVMTNIMGAPGLIELILFMSVYTVLIVTALNKCFSLIYHVPDRILTWIGGHAQTYGEEGALGQIKQGAESAAGKVSAAQGKLEESGGKAGQMAAEAGKKKEAQDKTEAGELKDKTKPPQS